MANGRGKKQGDKVPANPRFKGKSEKELFQIYRDNKGDIELRNELIQRNLYIAEILAKKYVNRGIEYDDIYQVASLGLIYAIERFDTERGFEFSSFATPTIIGEIKKYFRDKGWSIRVPRKIQEMSKKVNQAHAYLQNTKGVVPTISDVAKYLNIREEEVMEIMEGSQAFRVKSLDVTYENGGEDKDTALIDIIGEEDKSFINIENSDFIQGCLKKMTDMERRIITERFFNQKTQMSIAEELDISQMTVSRMEKKILQKIKKEYEKSIR